MLHQHFTAIRRARQRNHAGSEQIVWLELVRFEHVETTDDIRNQARAPAGNCECNSGASSALAFASSAGRIAS